MNAAKQDAPTDRLTRGNVNLDDRLESIERKLDTLLEYSLPMRVYRLEWVVYGGCGLVLTVVLGALLALVVMKGGQ